MEYNEKKYDVFRMFKRAALATAGEIGDYNCCTIGWGSLGNIWGRGTDIVTIYINPDRYTWDFCMKKDYFTVCWFPDEYREDLQFLGTHSGRDMDKVAHTKLTPVALGEAVGYKEANLTFVCKKLYQGEFKREDLNEEISEGIYKDWRPHYMFVGKIIDVIDNREE